VFFASQCIFRSLTIDGIRSQVVSLTHSSYDYFRLKTVCCMYKCVAVMTCRWQERGGQTALQVHRGVGAARSPHGRTAGRHHSPDTTAESATLRHRRRRPTRSGSVCRSSVSLRHDRRRRRAAGRRLFPASCRRRLQKTVPTSRSRRDHVLRRPVHALIVQDNRSVTFGQTVTRTRIINDGYVAGNTIHSVFWKIGSKLRTEFEKFRGKFRGFISVLFYECKPMKCFL